MPLLPRRVPLVVADDLVDHEADELLAELRVEIGVHGERGDYSRDRRDNDRGDRGNWQRRGDGENRGDRGNWQRRGEGRDQSRGDGRRGDRSDYSRGRRDDRASSARSTPQASRPRAEPSTERSRPVVREGRDGRITVDRGREFRRGSPD